MNIRIILLFILFHAAGFTTTVLAQEPLNPNWDAEKIKGTRYIPYPIYDGFPFLNDSWLPGKIEFASGEIADSLYLRYSSFKDDIIYYNKAITTQIVIDKASLNGFSFTEKDGRTRVFRKQYFDGFMKGDRYFEVLSDGETDLLVYRKVILITISPYKDQNNILKNQAYAPNYQYYFYSPSKGYASVRMNLGALLSKFDKVSQKSIKKLLRKNRIRILDENSFVRAWKVVEKEGFEVEF
ncbi:MAG: hypothetical protein K0M40_20520 [Prolixibacteraceae bacterium]|nr:hypothetical protein [Prolixibacteraceae bacterium]